MNAQKERVYVSVPVDMLTREQAEKLAHETAALLDMEKQEPVFNLGLDAPWEHLSRAMRLLGECDAVLFAPGWDYYPHFVCSVEFEAAIRAHKKCLYCWRDAERNLRPVNMKHCGGPERKEEEE